MNGTLRQQQGHGLPVTHLALPVTGLLAALQNGISAPASVQADSQCTMAIA